MARACCAEAPGGPCLTAESASAGLFPRLAQEPPRPRSQPAVGPTGGRQCLHTVHILGDLANALAGRMPLKRDKQL